MRLQPGDHIARARRRDQRVRNAQTPGEFFNQIRDRPGNRSGFGIHATQHRIVPKKRRAQRAGRRERRSLRRARQYHHAQKKKSPEPRMA